MKKKDLGFVERLLPVLISTGMVFGLVLCSGSMLEILRTREKMNQVARAYLLEMETVGYLTSERAQTMRTSLQECGLQDISLSGTTLNPVSYGNRIQIEVTGKMRVNLMVRIPFLLEKGSPWEIPIHIGLVSTAKH